MYRCLDYTTIVYCSLMYGEISCLEFSMHDWLEILTPIHAFTPSSSYYTCAMLSDLLTIAQAEFQYEATKIEHSNPLLTKYEYKKSLGTVHVAMRQQEVSSSMHGGL